MKYCIRTCIISKKKYLKNELLRFSVIDNHICINSNKGKGYYIFPSIENYEKLLKTKLLEHKLNIKISDQDYLSWKKFFIN